MNTINRLKKIDFETFKKKLITGELVILKDVKYLGTLKQRKVVKYIFLLDNIETHYKTSTTKDLLIKYAKKQDLIFDKK